MDSFIIIVPKSEGQPHSQVRAVIETKYKNNPVGLEKKNPDRFARKIRELTHMDASFVCKSPLICFDEDDSIWHHIAASQPVRQPICFLPQLPQLLIFSLNPLPCGVFPFV